jgi:acetyl/propionyl-CoA carboxylase alpha subunit
VSSLTCPVYAKTSGKTGSETSQLRLLIAKVMVCKPTRDEAVTGDEEGPEATRVKGIPTVQLMEAVLTAQALRRRRIHDARN